MHITLSNTGKRFNREWIFRNIHYTFTAGNSYAITGANGSGKSTLLQVIAGSIQVSEGDIVWRTGPENDRQAIIASEYFYKHTAIAAPYLDLVEEMTATEFLQFHASFKPFIPDISIQQILEQLSLQHAASKQIRYYSSGMKQRIKLAQAVFADTPVLFLDEPCTNLDAAGYTLYNDLIKKYCSNKLIIVSSNDVNEYNFCTQQLQMSDYK